MLISWLYTDWLFTVSAVVCAAGIEQLVSSLFPTVGRSIYARRQHSAAPPPPVPNYVLVHVVPWGTFKWTSLLRHLRAASLPMRFFFRKPKDRCFDFRWVLYPQNSYTPFPKIISDVLKRAGSNSRVRVIYMVNVYCLCDCQILCGWRPVKLPACLVTWAGGKVSAPFPWRQGWAYCFINESELWKASLW